MKYLAKSYPTEYSSVSTSASRASRRSVWTAAPMIQPTAVNDINHEAEVVRAISVAVPISLLLWVPLIWVAAQYL